MLANVRRVWVVQSRSSGMFLNEDLFFTPLLRHAGRCFDYESALTTAQWNLGEDYEISSFYERDDEQPGLSF